MKPDQATIRAGHRFTIPVRSRWGKKRMVRAAVLVLSALLISACMDAEQSKPSEYQVKAAYIYNFGKFVKWPSATAASQAGSFTICVLGEDPFGTVLQSTLAGATLSGKPVSVKRIAKPQDAANCHILFLNTAEDRHLSEILASLGQASVLTVSDIPDFSKRGGMIQFVLIGDRIRFEINRTNAEGAGLVLTSDLLKVASAVIGSGRNGDQ
jgi:YfiR/HmsC-like